MNLVDGLRANLSIKKDRIETLRREITLATGGMISEREQKADLEKKVGEAKWRLLKKPDVDHFLEELLEEAHARRIGYFERLLTALVMEVMPGESPIKLELSMKSGAPWLDIVSEIANGITEDVYEDQGGALTNVIILGLRMIAIAKSGKRRIIFLDESDCWVENSRVPSFYNVVRDAAKKIGFQCFAISHHDIRVFQGTKEAKADGNGITVASLYGHPKAEGGVHIDNDKVTYRWKDDEQGLRSIRLRNVQGYEDETIYLSPGVNGLVGPNNHGKSTVVRAVRAAFFGEIRSSLVSKGKDSCRIDFAFEHGRTLRFTRSNTKGPANLWELIGKNGAVIEEEGMKYSTPLRSGVPAWVHQLFGIGPIDKLDPQIIKQKEPIFLLDKGGHVRASVLSIGQETGHIQTMIEMHKKRCTEDKAVIKEGEELMGRVLHRIARLEKIIELEPAVQEVEEVLVEAMEALEQTTLLENMATRLQSANAMKAGAEIKLAAFDDLALESDVQEFRDGLAHCHKITELADRMDENRHIVAVSTLRLQALAGLVGNLPELTDNREAVRLGKAILTAKTESKKFTRQLAVLADLPDAIPEIKVLRDAERVVETIKVAHSGIDRADRDLKANELALNSCEAELHDLMEGMGHACPLCGQHIANERSLIGYVAEEVT